ncbi:hypothetical protein SUGI_0225840 [Cryptomeria japonica]|nr:hypothetical protein SUGI_0225840 [Cryptomeria japonica]
MEWYDFTKENKYKNQQHHKFTRELIRHLLVTLLETTAIKVPSFNRFLRIRGFQQQELSITKSDGQSTFGMTTGFVAGIHEFLEINWWVVNSEAVQAIRAKLLKFKNLNSHSIY